MATLKLVNFKASDEDHDRWKAEARAEGLSFAEWARRKLNSVHVPLPIEAGIVRKQTDILHVAGDPPIERMMPRKSVEPTVDPKDCVSRVPKGSFCKQCGSIHK